MNIGPTKEGTIVPIFEERLRQVGEWLDVAGEGIYESAPWKYQNDTVTPNVWYETLLYRNELVNLQMYYAQTYFIYFYLLYHIYNHGSNLYC